MKVPSLKTRDQAKQIIDSGALGRIINTTLVASSSFVENFPAKYDYLNDAKSGKR